MSTPSPTTVPPWLSQIRRLHRHPDCAHLGAGPGANSDIRVGVIGAGGRSGSHCGAFSNMKGVRLVAKCDVDPQVSAEYRDPRRLLDAIEMRKPKIQLQLGVSGSLKVDMTGSFYTGGKPAYLEAGQAKEAKKLMKPEGEWNRFRIQARGNTFTCWINGQKASEYTDPKFSGAVALGLQIHSGVEMKCEYRDLKVAEL